MSRLAVQIHKTVAELPLNINELKMILSADLPDIRSAITLLRNQGLIKADSQGRYVPVRELTEEGIKIMSMVERFTA